ncbi:MAG: hypothetical protein ACRDJW_25440 [Thermomicrobiales bacterium]
MEVLDFRRCPSCREEDFDLRSEEKTYGYGYPKLTLSETGAITAASWDGFDVDWSSSSTTRYFCGWCAEDLPEDYQAELDRVLGNDRYPDEVATVAPGRPLVFVHLDDEDEDRHGTFVLELTQSVDDPATAFFAAIQAFAEQGAPESTCFTDGETEAMLYDLALWIRDQDLAPFGLRWVRPAHAYELDGAFVVRRAHEE